MLEAFVKAYEDRTYTHTTLVRHKGVLIAFAVDKDRRILYSVLDPAAGRHDADGWFAAAKELSFPSELANVGYGVADQIQLPTVRFGGRPVPAGTPVRPDEIDRYLSSTARLTGDARVQVLADGEHLYVFRQSVAAGERDRIVTVAGPNGAPVPAVDATLLVDRFVLVGTALQPTREVRYQRSRSKTRPQSAQDSLGAADLDGRPFVEPTQALRFVSGLTDGRFSVLLVPTGVSEVSRWQIFAHNANSVMIDGFSIERSVDGLFNTRGSQFHTCVDHTRQFSLDPGTCPDAALGDPTRTCGKELVPTTSTSICRYRSVVRTGRRVDRIGPRHRPRTDLLHRAVAERRQGRLRRRPSADGRRGRGREVRTDLDHSAGHPGTGRLRRRRGVRRHHVRRRALARYLEPSRSHLRRQVRARPRRRYPSAP